MLHRSELQLWAESCPLEATSSASAGHADGRARDGARVEGAALGLRPALRAEAEVGHRALSTDRDLEPRSRCSLTRVRLTPRSRLVTSPNTAGYWNTKNQIRLSDSNITETFGTTNTRQRQAVISFQITFSQRFR